MKNVLKNLGPILVLIGVAFLVIYHFGPTQSNFYLLTAGIIMLVGAFGHVIINKIIK